MSDDQNKPVEDQAPEAAAEPTVAPAEAAQTPEPEAAPAAEETIDTTEASEEANVQEPVEVTNPNHAYKAKLVGTDDIRTGMTVKLSEKIKDISPKGEERERTQVFEGIILAMGGKGIARTITIRKVSKGFGVEKIYPINSPIVSKIELVKTAKVRRAKLNYLKDPKRRFKRKLRETFAEIIGAKKKKRKRA